MCHLPHSGSGRNISQHMDCEDAANAEGSLNAAPPLAARAEGAGRPDGATAVKFSIRVRIGAGEAALERTIVGRFAWTAIKLIEAGERGITAAELPAGIRLRRDGIPIAAEREAHGGAFSGSHARYRLAGQVTIIDGASGMNSRSHAV